jgi:CBS domain containing-hemolysin-like protein
MLLRRLTGGGAQERLQTTEEDLRVLVDAVEETEALEEDERDMITSIFEMSDRDVSEIMVPRIDMVALDASASVAEGLDLLIGSGHSRVPVYEGDLDHIIGIVHLRDLARQFRAARGAEPVGVLVRPVHVVPETKKIDELLHDFQHEFQEQHIQMAVVADEYGGTAGIVTIEDMIEEIVGEIRDEYDVEEDRIQRISDTEAIMDARVSIHDANEVLPLDLDDDDYDTIGGLVYEQLSKVPSAGDVVNLENATIRVLSTKGRRVQRVHIAMIDETPGNGQDRLNGNGSASAT